MPLIIGETSGGVLVPVLVDGNGIVSVSAAVTALVSIPTGSNVIGKVDAQNEGFVGAAWQKDPIRFGYSDTVYRAWVDTNLSGNGDYVDDSAVDPGEIWVITSYTARYVGTVPDAVYWILRHGGGDYIIHQQDDPASDFYYDLQGWWVLAPGDLLRLLVVGATAGDDLYGYATGYRVDIDQ